MEKEVNVRLAKNRSLPYLRASAMLALLLIPIVASAQAIPETPNILTNIMNNFLGVFSGGFVRLLPWAKTLMIILATIPVGIVGAALQHEFVKVFAKPELAATFLAVNGVILLASERMRRSRDAARGGGAAVPVAAGPVAPGPVAGGGAAARHRSVRRRPRSRQDEPAARYDGDEERGRGRAQPAELAEAFRDDG